MTSSLWFRILCVAAAGALGAVCRWGFASAVQSVAGSRWGTGWPWGTLAVNVLGCFLFGLLFAAFESRLPADSYVRLICLTGFLGAFTTYSTFAHDTQQLQQAGGLAWASANIIAHILLGWLALLLGMTLGKA